MISEAARHIWWRIDYDIQGQRQQIILRQRNLHLIYVTEIDQMRKKYMKLREAFI